MQKEKNIIRNSTEDCLHVIVCSRDVEEYIWRGGVWFWRLCDFPIIDAYRHCVLCVHDVYARGHLYARVS